MDTITGIRDQKSKRARKAGLLAVAALTFGLTLTACGPSDSATPSGSGSGTNANSGNGSNGGNGGDSADDRSAALVKYAQCMRAHGVPSFPDPVGGRLQLQARKGSELDPANPTFQAAQQACKDLEPPGLAQSGQGGQQQEDMLKYVDCMRKNGVPKFPDPQPDGRMLIDPSSGIDPQSPQFKAAQDTCRKLLPGGVAPGDS